MIYRLKYETKGICFANSICYAVYDAMPSSLHKYVYHGDEYGDGRSWVFDWVHKSITNDNIVVVGSPDDSITAEVSHATVNVLKNSVASYNGTVIGYKKSSDVYYDLFNTLEINKEQIGKDIPKLEKEEWLSRSLQGYSCIDNNTPYFVLNPGKVETYEIITTTVPGASGGTWNRIYIK